MPRYTDNDIKSATNVNLQEYAQAMGFELKKADSKSKKIEGYGGLYVFEKGFQHFSEDKKGNAIHFAREYLGMGFQDAVQSLLDFQNIQRELENHRPSYNQNNFYQKQPSKPKIQGQSRQYQQAPQQAYQQQAPPQTYEQVPHQPQQAPPQTFQEKPPDDFYGQPHPEEYWGEPPPEEYWGEPPPEEFWGEPPPQEFQGMPPESYEQEIPPPETFNAPPPIQPIHQPIPQATAQQSVATTPKQEEELVFEVPSMEEHESFQSVNYAHTYQEVQAEKQPTQVPQQTHAPVNKQWQQASQEEVPKEPMVLPSRSSDKSAYKSFLYLTEERCIDKDIVNNMMKQGKIFEASTQFKDWTFKNVAFVGTDKDNNPKYCSLRSVGGKKFTQDVVNSDKNFGFCMKGRSNRVFVCESPIDVMSHATLTKMNNVDYTQDSRISMGGLSDGALKQFLSDNPQITEIVFAFDNDFDKKNKEGVPTNYGQNYAQKCAKVYGEQGYKTSIHTPKGKDFNEVLVQQSKPSVKEQLQQLKNNAPKQTQPRPQKNYGER